MMIIRRITNDGWRHFVDLPQSKHWNVVRAHLAELPGAEETGFTTDDVIECSIDFTYEGQSFSINNQFGSYCFFVQEPNCSRAILAEVAGHFANLLEKRK